MFDPDHWTVATVTDRLTWDDGLFTLRLNLAKDFEAGQFAKLGLMIDGEHVHRAYSIGSAPGAPLEFYIVRVDGGQLTPHLDRLAPGDPVGVMNRIAGGFVLSKVPDDDARVLWLLATGTGLAPYVSMLRHGALWDRFDRVIVVHGVRDRKQLGYREELEAVAAERPGLVFLPACTRDEVPGCLTGRIPSLLASGALEAAGGAAMDTSAHTMICGNPEMIAAMREALAARGVLLHTPRRHGNLHLERYW
jgi:ferredoxin--NADP+ reductase